MYIFKINNFGKKAWDKRNRMSDETLENIMFVNEFAKIEMEDLIPYEDENEDDVF
jgi:hypothetical protein